MATEKEPEYHHIDRLIDQMSMRKMVQGFSASEYLHDGTLFVLPEEQRV